MMKLLTDRTLELPPFLLRRPDGGFVYKHKIAVPAVLPAPVIEPDYAAEMTKARDEAARAEILAAAEAEAKSHAAALQQARTSVKKAEKARMTANKMRQRKEFLKHFKWDIEG